MNTLADPRQAKVFRFVRCDYADGVAELVYAFDNGPEMIERIRFPDAPALPDSRKAAFNAALRMLHCFAGISYYKAGLPPRIEVETGALDPATADLLDALYLHGLGEFAYRNGLDLRGRIEHHPHPNPPLEGEGVAAARAGADRRRQGFVGRRRGIKIRWHRSHRDLGGCIAPDRGRRRAHRPADAQHRPRTFAGAV
jgi:hypothetical protein